MSDILIIEPSWTGHYLFYVRILVRAARAQGLVTTVALANGAEDTDEFRLHLGELAGDFVHVQLVPENSLWKEAARLEASYQPSRVIVPNADRFVMDVATRGLPGSAALVCLVMLDPRFMVGDGQSRPWAKRHLKRIAMRVAEARGATVLRLAPPSARSVPHRYVQDPVVLGDIEAPSPMEEYLRALPGKFWFTMVGCGSARKNPILALRAFERAALGQAGLLIVGPASDEVRRELRAAIDDAIASGCDIRWLDQPVPNVEMSQAVRFANAALLPYSTDAPPSTLGKAARLGTRLVVAGSPTFAAHAVALNCGAIVATLDEESLSDAMCIAASQPRPSPVPGLDERDFTVKMLGVDNA